MVVVITGPVRSGKSTHAMSVAREFGLPLTYLATARIDAADPEMAERISRHRGDRGDLPCVELWRPDSLDLPAVIGAAPRDSTLLVDSLGTWIAGHLLDLESVAESDPVGALRLLEMRTNPVIDAAREAAANVVFVCEETGWGLVPTSAQGRIFCDQLGRVCRSLAREAGRVELVVAGYALDLKAYGTAITPPL